MENQNYQNPGYQAPGYPNYGGGQHSKLWRRATATTKNASTEQPLGVVYFGNIALLLAIWYSGNRKLGKGR